MITFLPRGLANLLTILGCCGNCVAASNVRGVVSTWSFCVKQADPHCRITPCSRHARPWRRWFQGINAVLKSRQTI